MGSLLWLVLAAVALAGCKGTESAPRPNPRRLAETAVAVDERPLIAAFGDSLSAGYGVGAGESYPDFLQEELDKAGYRYRVLNAGISGDTTSGGLSRAGGIAAMKPAVVILALGGNDGLRGLPVERTRANLEQMIVLFKEAGAAVVLAGMTLPRNYGPDYIREFEHVYSGLARKHGVTFIPFLLEGVAGRRSLMQSDGIHPTAEGNRATARTVMRYVAPLLAR